MKKYILPLLSILILSISLSSCKKDANCDNNLPFIEVGNKFTYSFERILQADTTFTIEILGNPSNANYAVRYTGGWYDTFGDVFWKVCGNQFSVNNLETDSKDKNIVYKKDAAANDSWSAEINGSGTTRTVFQKGVTITTPAGTFICDKYLSQVTGAFNTDTIWMSEEVGFVKYEGFLFDYELLSISF